MDDVHLMRKEVRRGRAFDAPVRDLRSLLPLRTAMDKSVQKLDTTDSESNGDSDLQASSPAKERTAGRLSSRMLDRGDQAYEATIRQWRHADQLAPTESASLTFHGVGHCGNWNELTWLLGRCQLPTDCTAILSNGPLETWSKRHW
jgi:hypothetical protein